MASTSAAACSSSSSATAGPSCSRFGAAQQADQEIELDEYGNPASDVILFTESDLETDSEDEGVYVPPYVVPERDQLSDYVNEIIFGIRRLTPAMREMAKSQILIILQRYVNPGAVPRSVPRVSRHG